jgi:hypothetical protein
MATLTETAANLAGRAIGATARGAAGVALGTAKFAGQTIIGGILPGLPGLSSSIRQSMHAQTARVARWTLGVGPYPNTRFQPSNDFLAGSPLSTNVEDRRGERPRATTRSAFTPTARDGMMNVRRVTVSAETARVRAHRVERSGSGTRYGIDGSVDGDDPSTGAGTQSVTIPGTYERFAQAGKEAADRLYVPSVRNSSSSPPPFTCVGSRG